MSPFSQKIRIYAAFRDCFEVIIAGEMVLENCSPNADEFSVVFEFIAGVYYNLIVNYKEISGAASASLSWRSIDIARGVIPSSNLFYWKSVSGFPVSVRSYSGPPCELHSYSSGHSLSLATAGSLHEFVVHVKDAYENYVDQTFKDQITSYYSYTGDVRKRYSALDDHVDGLLTFLATPTYAETFSSSTFYATAGGLMTEYYDDTHFSNHYLVSTTTSIINHNWESTQDFALSSLDRFSVRWSGFVRPKYAQEYTFYAAVHGSDERVKLWVDNSVVIDAWSSLSSTEVSGSIGFDTSNRYYDIKLDYKNFVQNQKVQLKYYTSGSSSVSKSVVTSTRLFQGLL